MEFNFIDLFAGCGGMSMGFEMAGWKCIGFVEFWQPAIDTYLKNCQGVLIGKDITKISDEEVKNIGKVNLIVGGPPCQGFSLAGRRRVYDPRNRLFEEFVRFVRILQPEYFVMENVPAIGSMKNMSGGFIITEVFEAFKKEGYEVECKVLNSENYGVPEARRRAIFIGNRIGKKNEFPDFVEKKVFLKEVLNLPYEEIESIQHIYEKVATDKAYKFSFVKPGENYGTFRTSNRRLKIDSFSYTITKGGRYIHPIYHRLLSVREEARIQSFPDSFIFTGSKDNMYAQIGNAVPVNMARAIGKQLMETNGRD